MTLDGFVERARTAADGFSANGDFTRARLCLGQVLVLEPDNSQHWFHGALIEREWAHHRRAATFYLRGGIIEGFASSARMLLNQLRRANADFTAYRHYFRDAKRQSLSNRGVHLSVEKHLLNAAGADMDDPARLAAARIVYPQPVTAYLDGDLAQLPEGVAFHDMFRAGVISGGSIVFQPGPKTDEAERYRFVRYKRETGARFDTAFFGGYGTQYYHWSIETTHNIRHYIEQGLDVPLLVPGPNPPGFQREMLALLGLTEKACPVLSNPGLILTKTLIVTRHVGAEHCMEPAHILWLRDVMRDRVAEARSAPGAEKIYISRGDTRRKRVTYEDLLIEILEDKGFSILELGRMSLAEQIAAFARARVVVGPKGAGLTNLIYCSQGTRVVELTPTIDPEFRHFERLSAIVGADHVYVRSVDAEQVALWGAGHDAPAEFDHDAVRRAIAGD
jgi:hypothetical protein